MAAATDSCSADDSFAGSALALPGVPDSAPAAAAAASAATLVRGGKDVTWALTVAWHRLMLRAGSLITNGRPAASRRGHVMRCLARGVAGIPRVAMLVGPFL